MPPRKPKSRDRLPARRATGADPVGSSLKAFCRCLPATTEDIKWQDHHMFSVGGKIYASFNLDDEESFGFTCDDDDYDRLTAVEGIIPAPYAARFGWVRVERRRSLSNAEARALLRKSHQLVAAKLPARQRRELGLSG